MPNQSLPYRFLILILFIITSSGCGTSVTSPTLPSPESGQSAGSQAVSTAEANDSSAEEVARSPNWNEATHGKDAAPDYTVVFPQDSVNRIDITLSEEAWASLQAEMTEQFGQAGAGTGNPGQMPGRADQGNPPGFPAGQQPPFGEQPPNLPSNQANPPAFAEGQPPTRPGGMGGLDFGETSYVSSTVTFNGETWESVGFRYSGNSTLQTSWRSGTLKISFRLDFDEFEDEDPATTDQRFYGFKQISFKSNAMDASYLREKVVADIFRDAGVVSSQTAFYEVYVDFGAGPQYFGLYTAVEIVDDTVIETQFEDGSGNVYKPEGSGAAFVDGTFNEETFEKQTNQEEGDWSDIQAVFTTLNSDLRTSDPAAWRAGLEAVFDVDAFIRWLAADTIIQNWDTYGSMAHNYYLYTDPSDSRVTWIPWDNNMALSASAMGPVGGDNRRGGPRGVRELDLSLVTDQWPLIRFLMDDPLYLARYQQYLEETIQDAFVPQELALTYQKYHDLIAPYVEKETEGYTQLASLDQFNQSVEELVQHAQARYEAVLAYLGINP